MNNFFHWWVDIDKQQNLYIIESNLDSIAIESNANNRFVNGRIQNKIIQTISD